MRGSERQEESVVLCLHCRHEFSLLFLRFDLGL